MGDHLQSFCATRFGYSFYFDKMNKALLGKWLWRIGDPDSWVLDSLLSIIIISFRGYGSLFFLSGMSLCSGLDTGLMMVRVLNSGLMNGVGGLT